MTMPVATRLRVSMKGSGALITNSVPQTENEYSDMKIADAIAIGGSLCFYANTCY